MPKLTSEQSSQCLHNVPGYYWRDYTGVLPGDAVPGGLTVNRHVTHIGQVFSACGGIFTATIYPNQAHVDFPYRGSKRSEGFVQILCSRNTNLFRWIPVNNKLLQMQTLGYNVVRGGQEAGKWLNIGRIQYQGEIVIGKVCSGLIGDAKLWFVHQGSEYSGDDYEILVYGGQN